MTSSIDFEALAAPFPSADLEWLLQDAPPLGKAGRGTAVPYMNARAVQNRLDQVCGPANWKVEYKPGGTAGAVLCVLSLRVDGEWVAKEDGASFGEGKGEMAIKGGYSNALKRAATMWQIGRYLYALPPQSVEIDTYGRMKHKPRLPDWALPESERGQPEEQGCADSQNEAATTHHAAEQASSSGSASQAQADSRTNPPASSSDAPPADSSTYAPNRDASEALGVKSVQGLKLLGYIRAGNTPAPKLRSYVEGSTIPAQEKQALLGLLT